jgi:hypothetical protein
MGLKIRVYGKGEIEFGVTSLTNRKSKALYRVDKKNNMEILSYFRTDKAAKKFDDDLEFIFKNCRNTTVIFKDE